MQVQQFLERSAATFPHKTALVCGSRRLTYADLDTASNTLAHSLVNQGVRRGDRVAIYLDNSVEAVISIFAVWKAGAVTLVINPATRADKLAYILNHSRAAGMITDQPRTRVLHQCWQVTPHVATVWVAGEAGVPVSGKHVLSMDSVLADRTGADAPPPHGSINLDLAALIYTSGSTGRPKGVMSTHLNIVSAATSIETYLEHSSSDIILSVLPLAFGYGLYQLLVTMKSGGTLVLEKSFAFPYSVLETMARERVTGFALVPTIAAMLLQLKLDNHPLPCLRYVTNAAAALPVQHLLDLHRLWPHVRIFSMYGQTECTRISYLDPSQIEIRPGSVGRGIPNQEVYIVDESGTPVPPGMVGELVVRGAHVNRGYWEDPEATDRVFRPGPVPGERVLYTGDLFRADEEGYLYFVARRDDIIKTRGEKVSPKEVEDVLCTLNGVAEAAVVGVPDPILGQVVKAFVTLREGSQLTEKAILRHCFERLEDFMVPKIVEIATALPKTMSGKILKRELAASGQVPA